MFTNLDNQIKNLLSEYNLTCSNSEKYFGYMYSTINFFVVAMSALVVFALRDAEGITYLLIFTLILPVVDFIFGLFYCFNSYAIARLALFQRICEKKIKVLTFLNYRNDGILAWTHFVSSNRDFFILPYGTLLIFFILLPPASVFLGWFGVKDTINFDAATWIIMRNISVAAYVIFIIFMIALIFSVVKMLTLTKKVQLSLILYQDFFLFKTTYKK